ncbi:MAG TPA: lactate racemase domain-containing protein [Anaerolineales bacterium]|nr:lactate racemase domain-containing protein [Anaerolineales bacterium]
MLQTQAIAPAGQYLTGIDIRHVLARSFEKQFTNQRLLVLIPDHTRSLPLPLLFKALVEVLQDSRQLDFMVALGTHPPLSEDGLQKLVGISCKERTTTYAHIGLLNHAWDDPSALISLGNLEWDQIQTLAGQYWHPSLPSRVDVQLNKAAIEYDHILILGPTFPHEVVGFSGGAKYLFPGIAGPAMINATHWLGALAGVVNTIGIKDTPVRAMIHAAAQKLPTAVTLIALVVDGYDLSGLFVGDHITAWSAAADLSALRHICWCSTPYQRVLSCAPPMYDELWTAAKAMYKLEPAIAPGGEVIIYAPHLDVVSHVHGKYIDEIGYHILPYFLANWERFKHIPLGILAHSTHLRGSGHMENGLEKPNVQITLSSKISPEDCARLKLGYLDPAQVKVSEWQNRQADGILYVPKAGEILYRLQTSPKNT